MSNVKQQAYTCRVAILAAGQASRFGGPKQLAGLGKKTMLQRVIELARKVDASPMVLLGAHRDQIIMQLEQELAACECIVSDRWHDGLSATLQRAAEVVLSQDKASHLMVMLADQPALTEGDLRRLLCLSQNHPERIVCSQYPGGKSGDKERVGNVNDNASISSVITRGVPAIFPKSLLPELFKLRGDRGAQVLLQRDDCLAIELEGSLVDIDDEAALEKYKQRLKKAG